MPRPVRAQRPWTASSHRPRTRPVLRRSASGDVWPQHDRPPTGDGARALTIDVRQGRTRPLVTVSGELDLASSALLTAMLEHVRRDGQQAGEDRTGSADVDLDLSRVTFADSCGLAPALDGRTSVVAASVPVRRVLRLLANLPLAAPAPEAALDDA